MLVATAYSRPRAIIIQALWAPETVAAISVNRRNANNSISKGQ